MLLMGPSLVAFSYFTSYLFSIDTRGFIAHGILHIIISTNLPIVPIILRHNYPESNSYLLVTALISLIPTAGLTCALTNI